MCHILLLLNTQEGAQCATSPPFNTRGIALFVGDFWLKPGVKSVKGGSVAHTGMYGVYYVYRQVYYGVPTCVLPGVKRRECGTKSLPGPMKEGGNVAQRASQGP